MLYETTITKIPLGELAETLEYINRNEESDERADAENKMDKFLYEINARAAHMTKSVKEVNINSVEVYGANQVKFAMAEVDTNEDDEPLYGLGIIALDDDGNKIATYKAEIGADNVLVFHHMEGACNVLVYIEREGSHE